MENIKKSHKLLITASGWTFSRKNKKRPGVSNDWKILLKHPNWVMGQKITVDSATLVNKGLGDGGQMAV